MIFIEKLDRVAKAAPVPRRHGDNRKGARGGKIAANRVRSALSKLLNWAIARDLIETSPITNIESPGAERRKTRAGPAGMRRPGHRRRRSQEHETGHGRKSFFL
jgi:hypothetical protein